jgi:hypothetical protein
VGVETYEGGRKSVVIAGSGLSSVVTYVQIQKQDYNIFKIKDAIGLKINAAEIWTPHVHKRFKNS